MQTQPDPDVFFTLLQFLPASLLAYGLTASLFLTPAFGADRRSSQFSFEGHQIALDTYPAQAKGGTLKATLALLHGASGPEVQPYRQQAEYFADHGFTVVVPHYFDATKTTAASPQNYASWARLIAALTSSLAVDGETAGTAIFVVGYSLEASVALAAGSQGLPVAAIAEWYGSLPDEFFYSFKSMPSLLILHGQRDTNIPVSNAEQLVKLCAMKHLACENHIYADQAHGFTGSALEDADARTLEFFSTARIHSKD